jgi:hypothetical protein
MPGQVTGDRPGGVRRSLPLAALPTAPGPLVDTVYSISVVDKAGRIGDRSLIRSLGWVPGTRLDMHERTGLILVRASADGVHRVSDTGFATLPLTVRRWCRMRAGDRVLLAGYLVTGMLVIHPLPVIHTLLAEVYAQVYAQVYAAVGGEGR